MARQTDAEKRAKRAKVSLIAWYCQIPISLGLALASIFLAKPWPQIFIVYLVAISVWTGIESGHARLNADQE